MIKELELKNKIYIIGSVASGKSTFAKKLATHSNIPLYEQDNIVHNYNKKRSEYERDQIFNSIINQNAWIIEGVYHDYFDEGLKRADVIIWLDPPTFIVRLRILKRWIKQKIKLERGAYTPSFRILFLMFKWNNDYNRNKSEIQKSLIHHENKIIVIKNNKL